MRQVRLFAIGFVATLLVLTLAGHALHHPAVVSPPVNTWHAGAGTWD